MYPTVIEGETTTKASTEVTSEGSTSQPGITETTSLTVESTSQVLPTGMCSISNGHSLDLHVSV
jgi:hypothetical protein